MEECLVQKGDVLRELVEEYKIAVDMLSLAEIISIEEHRERHVWIKKWEEKLYNVNRNMNYFKKSRQEKK